VYYRLHHKSIGDSQACDFLPQPVRGCRQFPMVLWDSGRMDKGPAVRAPCGLHRCLQMECLPAYAQEATPANGACDLTKKALTMQMQTT
jgi:hypothetical protein